MIFEGWQVCAGGKPPIPRVEEHDRGGPMNEQSILPEFYPYYDAAIATIAQVILVTHEVRMIEGFDYVCRLTSDQDLS